jgi:hypothetical protein
MRQYSPLFVLLLSGWTSTAHVLRQNADNILCSANSREVMVSTSAVWPWQMYRTSSATPPNLAINWTSGRDLFDGLLFFDPVPIAPVSGGAMYGPLIMDDTGELVWNGDFLPAVSNMRVQTLNGKPVLSYWSGSGTAGADNIVGHGYGEVKILDTNYNEIATVCPKLKFQLPPGVQTDCFADIHESFITSRNTILVTLYNTTSADLTSVGGPKTGYVLDSMAAEINITTGEVIFSWSPLQHMNLTESYEPLAGTGLNASAPYDFFHMNAIQMVGENYLINSRHYWTTYLVSPQGEILWQINGETGGDFGAIPEGGHFVSSVLQNLLLRRNA